MKATAVLGVLAAAAVLAQAMSPSSSFSSSTTSDDTYWVVFDSSYTHLTGGMSSATNSFAPAVMWTTTGKGYEAWAVGAYATPELKAYTDYYSDSNQLAAANAFAAFINSNTSATVTVGNKLSVSPASTIFKLTVPSGDRYFSWIRRIGGTPDFFVGVQNVDLGASHSAYVGPVTLYGLSSNQYQTKTLNTVPVPYPPRPASGGSSNGMYAPQPIIQSDATVFMGSTSLKYAPVGTLSLFLESAPPKVTKVSPATIHTGSIVTITGIKFGSTTNAIERSVTIGGKDCPVEYSDGIAQAGATFIQCQAPSLDDGTYDVVVTVAGLPSGTTGKGLAIYGKGSGGGNAGSAAAPLGAVVVAVVAGVLAFF